MVSAFLLGFVILLALVDGRTIGLLSFFLTIVWAAVTLPVTQLVLWLTALFGLKGTITEDAALWIAQGLILLCIVALAAFWLKKLRQPEISRMARSLYWNALSLTIGIPVLIAISVRLWSQLRH
jgi:hypothetical protein